MYACYFSSLLFLNFLQVIVLLGDGNLIAVSESITFANPNEPLQIHAALSAQCASCITVMWNTQLAAQPTLRIGTQSGAYASNISAQTHTYSSKDLCGEPAMTFGWLDPGLFHEAIIELEVFYIFVEFRIYFHCRRMWTIIMLWAMNSMDGVMNKKLEVLVFNLQVKL